MEDNTPIIETIEQARHFIGGGSALSFSARSLVKLKEEAKEGLHMLHSARVNCTDPAKRMHFNGSIAARNAIINKIDSLLKLKNL